MFQFYLSSIKSVKEFDFHSLKQSFNSTLVQLKVLSSVSEKLIASSFNSTLVQLKGIN